MKSILWEMSIWKILMIKIIVIIINQLSIFSFHISYFSFWWLCGISFEMLRFTFVELTNKLPFHGWLFVSPIIWSWWTEVLQPMPLYALWQEEQWQHWIRAGINACCTVQHSHVRYCTCSIYLGMHAKPWSVMMMMTEYFLTDHQSQHFCTV